MAVIFQSFLLALLPAAFPGVSAEPAAPPGINAETDFYFARLDGILEDFASREVLMRARLKDLKELQGAYLAGPSPEETMRRRRLICEELQRSSGELETLKGAFRARQNLINITAFTTGVRSHLRGDARNKAAGLSLKLAEYDLAFSRMNRFQTEVMRALREDVNASRQLELRIERARVRRRILFAGAAAVTFIALFILILNRRRWPAAPAAAVSEDPAAPSAEEGPAGFRIERELGRGERGTVYAATDLELDRRVAVKRMCSSFLGSAGGTEEFVRQARSVAALRHPNILEIYAVLREDGRVFVVSEFVEGASLQALLDSEERLPPGRAAAVVSAAAEGLDYARAARVPHGGLKPGAILVGAAGAVKVKGFGVRGTPAYSAPEASLSGAGDVFSLGVCAYEMLTGRLPFRGPNYRAQKAERLYPAPSSAGLPPALDGVFAKVLAPSPAARYASAREFGAALRSALV